MGNGQHYLKNGGFSSYFYVSRGVISFDGFTAKIITWYNTKDNHESLPRFSKNLQDVCKTGQTWQCRTVENIQGQEGGYRFRLGPSSW